jgi:ankyrin repeat protein
MPYRNERIWNKRRKIMHTDEGKTSEKKQQALDLALFLAAYDGKTDIVKALLKAGANVHAGDEHALEIAVLHGHTDTAKALLEAGADPRDESSPDAAWRLAAMNGHIDTVKALFEWTNRHPPQPPQPRSPEPPQPRPPQP